MPKRFEDILKALPLDAKDRQVIELSHEHELEFELELLKNKHGNELELLKNKHGNELELLKNKHGNELELLKNKHGNELELLENKHGNELKLLKKDHDHQLDKLKTELSAANWEIIKHLKLVELKSFIDKFEKVKKLDTGRKSSKTYRFTKFAKENEDLLKSWNLSTQLFDEAFDVLYTKLCRSAHPIFNTEDKLEIEASHLEHIEIQLIGFLWEAFPLPPEKLLIRMLEKSESVSTKYKIEL